MCGIVAYLGRHPAVPILLGALERMEYRGYDSAGIATVSGDRIKQCRAVGKLRNLRLQLDQQPVEGSIGIGHTRWATHGPVTLSNAHPHLTSHVALVHNGTIENADQILSRLEARGYLRQSDTDTEVVAMLCQHHLDSGLSAEDAVKETIKELSGAFALCFLFIDRPDLVIAVRRGAPLAVAQSDGAAFATSDAMALSPMVEWVTHLAEGDVAILSRSGYEILNENGQPVQRMPERLSDCWKDYGKAGYPYYMAREIHDQPAVAEKAIATFGSASGIDFPGIDKVVLIACGTARHACMVAEHWFESIARLPASAEIASEFRYRDQILGPRSLAILVSQSGETADTLAALEHVQSSGVCSLSLVNVESSSMARLSGSRLLLQAGMERSVASTKAFICQLAALASVVIEAASQRDACGKETESRLIGELRSVPSLLDRVLRSEPGIKEAAADLAGADNVMFMGRGLMFPLALEGALKLMEVTYIHAEGFAAGELKHGPIALVDDLLPAVVLAPNDRLLSKILLNAEEIAARGAQLTVVASESCAGAFEKIARHLITVPDCDPQFAPFPFAVPMQLLAYHVALLRGTDVDQPRNLAKSVTVE